MTAPRQVLGPGGPEPEGPFRAAQLLLQRPGAWGPQSRPRPSLSARWSAARCSLPGCFIYLFCTNRVAADSFSPGLKREREEKKKRRNAFWLFSLPWSWQQQQQRQRRAGGQGAVGVRRTGEVQAEVTSNGTGPQPRTDAAANLMPPSTSPVSAPIPCPPAAVAPFSVMLPWSRSQPSVPVGRG